ncbi:hypothetical protein SZ64_10990 [Erythrobacter sp. SG61-1L]|uniref:DUF2339 domain-containing protein n=1 Tax=Erythrobacter sp. SG61-1L TaxID=1603897 RepID=UPI0006C8F46B|nr:DUF2339 domain-containing protein [Erythrobacter sp. SG61-1L]KPL68583.1 hypothetical protein SZ64_10990 [Erythrobacter sp. SG61-1L]
MELILLGVAGWVIYLLWQRVEALQARLEKVEDDSWLVRRIEALEAADTTTTQPPAPAPAPAPAFERPPVPTVAPVEEIVPARPARPIPAAPLEKAPEPAAIAYDTVREAFVAGPAEDAPRPEPKPAWRPSFDFEDLFGRLLPIWAGGITLAVAGLFIVKYSIEAGLLTPPVRVLLAMMFGAGLLCGAELAFRFENRIADPRVRQALAGAGLATLYAGFYLAGTTYGLIGPLPAFAGLAAVTAGAIALSFRFGMPSAVLGLIGGFAAPLLVGGEQANIPLLTAYLALVTSGLTVTSRQRRWAWLGLAALGGGLGWGILLLLSLGGGMAGTFAVGLFLILLGVVIPAWAMPDTGNLRRLVEAAAAGVAALQMAVLIGRTDHSMLAWGLFALLAGALAVLGWKAPQLRRASGFASLLVPLLLVDWSNAAAMPFGIVAAAFTAILAGAPVALTFYRRQNRIDLLQLCLFTLALFGVVALLFGTFNDAIQWNIGAVALALAAFPALAAWRLWPASEQRSAEHMALVATAFALLMAGGLYVSPGWAAPVVGALLSVALLLLDLKRRNAGLIALSWAAAATVAVLLVLSGDFTNEAARLSGLGDGTPDFLAALRWAMPAMVLALLAWRDRESSGKTLAEVLAAIVAYGLSAQILPSDILAWFASAAALAALFALPQRHAGATAMTAIGGLWAIPTLHGWGIAGIMALAGEPMLVGTLPLLQETGLHLLPLAVSLGVTLLVRERQGSRLAKAQTVLFGMAALVCAHIAFKHLLAIDSAADFARAGLVERTLWEALLLAAAYGAYALRGRLAQGSRIAWMLAGIAGAHWFWFTLALHNPLLVGQHVGPVPIANLLLPAYGLPVAALLWLLAGPAGGEPRIRALADSMLMALLSVFAISALRQIFSGTDLTALPLGQTEDLLRSLTGIVLAILFLLWGARHNLRSWRIGSLAVMLLAVLKVFLVDAAGLEGLARIASFVALGFSLIGIGWFYARQLRRVPGSREVQLG